MYSNKNIPAPFNQPQHTNSRKENPAGELPTPIPSKNNAERLGKQRVFQMESAGGIHFPQGEQLCMAKKTPPPLGGLAKGKCFDKVSRLSSRRNFSVFPAVLLVKILILTKGEKKSPP